MKTALWAFMIGATLPAFGQQSFMPENELHLTAPLAEGVTSEEFQHLIDEAEDAYADIFAGFGAELQFRRLWTEDVVNAYAMQEGTTWIVAMYGGLARRTTPDGFTTVICHEIGHHLAGAVFKQSGFWASSEGQSDYFATMSCARKLWREQAEANDQAEAKLLAMQGGEQVQRQCDEVWELPADQKLCYRIAVAGKDLADLLSQGRGSPQFDTPDQNQVKQTSTAHPAAQCRLDTYVAGGLCPVSWRDDLIPGKNTADSTGWEGMRAAKPFACHAYKDVAGFRPGCWFKDLEAPNVEISATLPEVQPLPDETLVLDPIGIAGHHKVHISAKGKGIHLFVGLNKVPSIDDFDCRSRSLFLTKNCRLQVPKGMSKAYIMIRGLKKPQPVHVEINGQGPGKLCRDYDEGVGEIFDCYDGMQCRLTPGGAKNRADTWCIDY